MFISVCLCLFVMVLGLGVVVSNYSPHFSALGLVVVAGSCCAMLAYLGLPFLSLILFLIYLGGMIVVFGYATALAVDPFPVSIINLYVVGVTAALVVVAFMIIFGLWFFFGGSSKLANSGSTMNLLKKGTGGVPYLYWCGGVMLVFVALVLLLTLFVAVGVVWGLKVGVIRFI